MRGLADVVDAHGLAWPLALVGGDAAAPLCVRAEHAVIDDEVVRVLGGGVRRGMLEAVVAERGSAP